MYTSDLNRIKRIEQRIGSNGGRLSKEEVFDLSVEWYQRTVLPVLDTDHIDTVTDADLFPDPRFQGVEDYMKFIENITFEPVALMAIKRGNPKLVQRQIKREVAGK